MGGNGRYGGVRRPLGKSMQVPCVDSNEVLDKVIMRHGNVDILKIDIEVLEPDLVERLPRSLARRIKRIYVESKFIRNPLAQTIVIANAVRWRRFRGFRDGSRARPRAFPQPTDEPRIRAQPRSAGLSSSPSYSVDFPSNAPIYRVNSSAYG